MTVYQRILKVINEIREQQLVSLRHSQAETLADAITTEVAEIVREQVDAVVAEIQDVLDRIDSLDD